MYNVTFLKNVNNTLFMTAELLGGYYAFPNQGLNGDHNLHSLSACLKTQTTHQHQINF